MGNAESKTIADVEAKIEEFFLPATPPGMAARASIRYAEGHRKVRRDAGASYFDPAACEVVISFKHVAGAGNFFAIT